jgi:uncharacterized membrane protein
MQVPNVCEIKTSNGVPGMQCGGRSGGTYGGAGEAMATRILLWVGGGGGGGELEVEMVATR